jgi:hypothetical protein
VVHLEISVSALSLVKYVLHPSLIPEGMV